MSDPDAAEMIRDLKATAIALDRLIKAEGKKIGDAHGRTYALAAKEQVDDAKADAQRWQELNAELRRQMKPLTRHTYAHTALEKRLHELAAEAKRRGEGVPVEALLAAIDEARAVAHAKWEREQAQARQREVADA